LSAAVSGEAREAPYGWGAVAVKASGCTSWRPWPQGTSAHSLSWK